MTRVLSTSWFLKSESPMCRAVRGERITEDAPVSSKSLTTAMGFSLMDRITHCVYLSRIIGQSVGRSHWNVQSEQSDHVNEETNITLQKQRNWRGFLNDRAFLQDSRIGVGNIR